MNRTDLSLKKIDFFLEHQDQMGTQELERIWSKAEKNNINVQEVFNSAKAQVHLISTKQKENH